MFFRKLNKKMIVTLTNTMERQDIHIAGSAITDLSVFYSLVNFVPN